MLRKTLGVRSGNSLANNLQAVRVKAATPVVQAFEVSHSYWLAGSVSLNESSTMPHAHANLALCDLFTQIKLAGA